MLNKPEAIIFDWDNTLIDSLPQIDRAREETFIKFNAYAPEAELLNTCANKKTFFSQFGEMEEEAIDFFISTYAYITKDGVMPLAGAEKVLQLVQDAKIPMLIVSNKLNTLLNKEVEFLGWRGYFSKIIGSNDCPMDKPHPMPVYAALDAIMVPPSPKVLLIGDSTLDIKCAISANCWPILFGDKAEFDETQFLDRDIQHILDHDSLRELLLNMV